MDDAIVLVSLMRGFLSINTDMQFKRKLMRESSVMVLTKYSNSALREE